MSFIVMLDGRCSGTLSARAFARREQAVELLLVVVIAEMLVQLGARLHQRQHALLRAVAADAPGRRRAPPCSWRGTPTADTARCRRRRDAARRSVNSGVWPNSVMFASTGTPTAWRKRLYIARSVIASGKIMSAPASTYATARSIAASMPSTASASVRAMTTNDAIGARVDRRLDAVDHLVARDDFLARAVAAALGADLVFHVHGAGAGLDHRADGARDVECAAPAGVDVDQQRQRGHVGDAAHVDQHVVERA